MRGEQGDGLTWAHVERATAAEVGAQLRPRRQTEVCKVDVLVVLGTQDILRLEVAVVDAFLVAVLDGINDLQERATNGLGVVDEGGAVDDRVEEITTLAQVHDEEGVELLLDDRVKRDDVGVAGECAVVHDFAMLLAREQGAAFVPEQALHCIVLCAMGAGREIFGKVHDAICAVAESFK